MTPPPDLSALASFERKAPTGALLTRIEALTARVERLARRVAALEAENALLKAENAGKRYLSPTLRAG
jgi:cell division protein FtsB